MIYTHIIPVETKVTAVEGLAVYDKEKYRRQGKIVVACDSKRPGKVQVQWHKPKERLGWIRVTMLRCLVTSKRLTIQYT